MTDDAEERLDASRRKLLGALLIGTLGLAAAGAAWAANSTRADHPPATLPSGPV